MDSGLGCIIVQLFIEQCFSVFRDLCVSLSFLLYYLLQATKELAFTILLFLYIVLISGR